MAHPTGEHIAMSYDPACEYLARHFLGGLEGGDANERLIKELSQHIQDEVEAWIEAETDRLTKVIQGEHYVPPGATS